MKAHYSLRHLLLGMVVLFGLLVAGGQFAFVMHTYSAEMLSEIRALSRHAGRTLAANIESGLQVGDERHVAQLIASKATLPHLRYAAYLGADDRVVHTTAAQSAGRPAQELDPAPPAAFLAAPRQSGEGLVLEEASGNTLWAIFPVRLPAAAGAAGGDSGLVVLALDLDSGRQGLVARTLGHTLLLLIPIALLTIGVGVMLKMLLTDRIEHLLAYARAQVEGRDEVLPLGGRDEIGQLGDRLARLVRALVESRDFHVHLLDGMPNPIWRADASGCRDYFNRAWLSFTGRRVQQEYGDGWSEGVHPDDRVRRQAHWQDAFAGRRAFVIEYRLRHCDGGYHWVSDHGEPIFDAEGRFIGYLGSCFDLQAQKDAAAALAAAAEVVEASPTVLFRWLMAPGWPVLYVSENVNRWGYSAAEMMAHGFHFATLVHPDDIERVGGEVEANLTAGMSAYAQEYRLQVADGSYIWIEDLTSVQRDANGVPVRVEGLVTDISARRAAQDALERLNSELEERVAQRTAELAALNKELETFAYSVSHDLKAPLRGIDGYSHLLEEDYGDRLDDEGRLFIRNIRSGVRQMARLIDDLLAYSRIERRNLQRSVIDLPALVQRILAERATELEQGGAQIEVDVPAMTVLADPDGLAQVLRNLVDNALKYSRDAAPPRVCIGARHDDGVDHLWVRDNGIGFDMKFHDRIFEIFQRLQRAEDYDGTGVGLAIVRRAVTRMGGRVWAESAPGAGATFHLELPA